MSKIIYAPPSPPPHHNTDVSVFPSLQPPTPAPAPPLAPPTSCAVTHEVSRTHAPFRTGVWRHGVKYNAHRRNDLRGGEGGGAGLAERGTGMIAKSCRSNLTEHTHQKKKTQKAPSILVFTRAFPYETTHSRCNQRGFQHVSARAEPTSPMKD